MRSNDTSSTRTFITPTVTPEVKEQKPHRTAVRLRSVRKTKNLPWIIIAVLAVVSIFLFVQYKQAQHKLQSANAPAVNTKQINSLVGKVGKLIILPPHETPTVATITDVSKLKSQSFFSNAENGDKVLVFSQQKEAILYRPSSNQIVTVAPVNVSAGSSGTVQN